MGRRGSNHSPRGGGRLTIRDPRPKVTTAAKAKKIRASRRKGATVSPIVEQLHIPEGLTLSTRQGNPLTAEEAMVLRDRDGRTLARIEALRADLLPN